MKRTDLALRLTRAIHRSEDSVDAALEDATCLVQEMLGGRKAVGLSATVASEAWEAATSAIGLLGNARAQLVAAHASLSAAAPTIGIRHTTQLMGPGQTKPDDTGAAPTGFQAAG